MTEEQRIKLDLVWRGERCAVCQFPFDQIEIDDMEETQWGWAHKSCAKEDLEEVSEKTNNKLL